MNLDEATKVYPLVIGVLCFLLYLGALHQMIRSNNNAIRRLFKDLEDLHDHKVEQRTLNAIYESELKKIEAIIASFTHDSAMRYSELTKRMDSFFELLGKKNG